MSCEAVEEPGFANVCLRGGVDKFSACKWECLVSVFLCTQKVCRALTVCAERVWGAIARISCRSWQTFRIGVRGLWATCVAWVRSTALLGLFARSELGKDLCAAALACPMGVAWPWGTSQKSEWDPGVSWSSIGLPGCHAWGAFCNFSIYYVCGPGGIHSWLDLIENQSV